MKLTIRTVIATLFVGISVSSLGFILFESSNYCNYYWQGRSAILDSGNNNTKVNAVRITKDFTTGQIIIRISVSATNPTNYWGFSLQRFDLACFFLHAGYVNQSVFQDPNSQLLANLAIDKPLSPMSTVSADLLLNLNSTQSSSYRMFNQTYNGNVNARVVLHTIANSFLDPVYGVMTTLKQQDIPVS